MYKKEEEKKTKQEIHHFVILRVYIFIGLTSKM